MFKERETYFPHEHGKEQGFDIYMNCRSDSFITNGITMRKKTVPSSLASSGDDELSTSPTNNNSYCVRPSGLDFGGSNKKIGRMSLLMSSPTSNNNNHNNNMRCFGCGQIIQARYYVLAMDHHFHNECLKCQLCSTILSEEPTCYEKDGRILCKQDYSRLYHKPSPRHPRRCARCTNLINPNDLVMRACDLVYHIDCFVCTVCQRTLNRGDEFRMQSTDLYCRQHYDLIENFNSSEEFPPCRTETSTPNSKSNSSNNKRGRPPKRKLLSGSPQNSLEKGDGSLEYFHPNINGKPPSLGSMGAEFNQIMESPMNGFSLTSLAHGDISGVNMNINVNGDVIQSQNKGKRMRTTFKHNQLRVMKQYFEINPNPDTKELKSLSVKTQLCKRVLQVWFQNARAKHRRTCPRSESSLSGGGALHIEDSQEWSPSDSFGQPIPSEHGSLL